MCFGGGGSQKQAPALPAPAPIGDAKAAARSQAAADAATRRAVAGTVLSTTEQQNPGAFGAELGGKV